MARTCLTARWKAARPRLVSVVKGAAGVLAAGLVAMACASSPATVTPQPAAAVPAARGAAPAAPAAAALPAPSLSDQGRAFVTARCSTCHAVERSGESPVAEAPPFRTLSARYPLENLAEGLAEGLYVGHPVMPEFELTPDEVDAVIAWIGAIQDAPGSEAPPPRSP